MTNKNLKLMAGNIVMESDYSNSAKKQLLNFITEANEAQVKTLILDGKIESLKEDAIDIVNKRFKINLENALQENITETQEFLTIGREVICDLIESQGHSPKKFEKMIDFVVNEATDYQVLSMLMEGSVPEKYNYDKEYQLVENLNLFTGTTFVPLVEQRMSSGEQQIQIDALNDRISKIKGTLSHLKGPKAAPYVERLNKETAKLKKLKLMRTAEKGLAKGEEVAGKAKAAVTGAAHKVATFAQTPAGQAIGGLAAAALISYAAYKIYKNYFSKAARACKGAPDKSVCMKQYKNKALQAQIAKLSSGAGQCSKSKDPEKCKAAIQSKVAKLRSKMK